MPLKIDLNTEVRFCQTRPDFLAPSSEISSIAWSKHHHDFVQLVLQTMELPPKVGLNPAVGLDQLIQF